MPALPKDQVLSLKARNALEALLKRGDPAIVGIVVTGSAARGLASEHSDVDVIVIRDEDSERTGPGSVGSSPGRRS